MEKEKEIRSTLKVQEGISQPPSINPGIILKTAGRKKKYSVEGYVDGILSGDRTILSQAITLVESSLPKHYEDA
jgi:LAO/AO transport system kinase